MLLEEAFPTLAEGLPHEIGQWPVDYHDGKFVALLLRAAWAVCGAARQDSIDALEEKSIVIISEAVSARSHAEDDAGRAVLDTLILQTATAVVTTSGNVGEISRPHEWIIRALTDEYHGDGDYDLQWQRLLAWTWFPGPLRRLALDATLAWLGAVFIQAGKVGDHLDLAEQAAPYVDIVLRDERARAAVTQVAIVAALTARLNWATLKSQADVPRTLAALDELLDGSSLAPSLEAHIYASIALSPVPLRESSGPTLAREVLRTHREHLRAAERLRLLVTGCGGEVEQMRKHEAEITDAIGDTRAAFEEEADNRVSVKFGEASTFEAIGPLVAAYAEDGDLKSLLQTLRSWLGVADKDSWSPLVGIVSHRVGTLWVLDGRTAPTLDTEYDGHAGLMAAANGFLSTSVVFRDVDDFQLVPTTSPGTPKKQSAAAYLSAAGDHLHLGALKQLLESTDSPPSELVVAPSWPLPLQALLSRELGYVPALCVSLRRPRSTRPIRRAVLLGDNTTTSERELFAVRRSLERAGAEVVTESATVQHFEAAYADDTNDVIWVAAHGEFAHLQPDASRLVLADDEVLDVATLGSLREPAGDRRLLVLNICDGAASATLGGLAGFGIGPVLAGPTQSVVSNLWPIEPLVAASFGAIFAKALAADSDHRNAFRYSVEIMEKGRSIVQETIEALGEDAGDLAVRIRNQESVDFDGLTAWGAPALLV